MKTKRFRAMLVFTLMLAILLPSSAYAAGENVKKVINYVALGDSIAYGTGALPVTKGYTYLYRDYLAKTGNVDFKNFAIPGLTSVDLVSQLANPDVVNAIQGASLITISNGGNDLLKCVSADFQSIDSVCGQAAFQQFAINWQTIISTIRSINTQAYIQVINVYNPFNPTINRELRTLADQIIVPFNNFLLSDPRYKVIDVYSAFKGKELLYTYFYFPRINDVHPTNVGHLVIANLHVKDFLTNSR